MFALLLDDIFKKYSWVLGDTSMSSKFLALKDKKKQFCELIESFGALAKKRKSKAVAHHKQDDGKIEDSLREMMMWSDKRKEFQDILSS